MRMALIITSITILCGCAQPEEVSHYPDCFEGTTSTVDHNGGCGSLNLYAYLDSTRLVTVSMDAGNLALETTCQTFDMAAHHNDIRIRYYTYAHPPASLDVDQCSTLTGLDETADHITKYTARSGTVTVAVSRASAYRTLCEDYKASVKLDSVLFRESTAGKAVAPAPLDTLITQLIIRDQVVGYCQQP